MKYFIIKQLKTGELTTAGCCSNYCRAIRNIGKSTNSCMELSFSEIEEDALSIDESKESKTECINFRQLKCHVIRFIKDFFDVREGLERDVWYALKIPGVKLSATIKSTKPRMSFEELPHYYRESVKRYMKTLIYRRSWSFCKEILMYIRYFYKSFYEHGYDDGFLENLTRIDIEKYLQWVAEDYENR